jgi:hypothetical protein
VRAYLLLLSHWERLSEGLFKISFNSFILFKASIGVKLFKSISFNFSSTLLSFLISFSTIFTSVSTIHKDNCFQDTLLCSISNILSIFFASLIVSLDIQAIFATSNQKDFFIHHLIIFLKKIKFSSFSHTATEKFSTQDNLFDSSINS